MEIVARTLDLLWLGSLIAVPLAGVVALVCGSFHPRPASRHALWFATLLSLVMPLAGAIVWEAPKVPSARVKAIALEHLGLAQGPRLLPLEPTTAQIDACDPRSAAASSLILPPDIPMWECSPPDESSGAPLAFVPLWAETVACDASTGETATTSPAPACPTPEATHGDHILTTRLTSVASAILSATLERVLFLRDTLTGMPPFLPALWLGGALVLLAIQAGRIFSGRCALRTSSPADASLLAMVQSLSPRLGLARAPETAFVHARISPMIWCGRRPRLLLPRDLWESLDDRARRGVLVHELAHLARRDHLLCWIEILLGALYWWHPVVWWVRRKVRDEADASCDAWVTALLPADRRRYAEALLATKSFVRSPRLASGLSLCILNDRTKVLSRRITMVMTQHQAPTPSAVGTLSALALLGMSAFVMPGLACPTDDVKPASSMAVAAPTAPSAPASPTLDHEAAADRSIKSATREPTSRSAEAMPNRSGLTTATTPRAMTVLGSDPASAPSDAQTTTISGPSSGTTPRPYDLPAGKLEAISALMARQDVPIWVEIRNDHIVVHATPEQHRVFEAFVKMIHPSAGAASTSPRALSPRSTVAIIPPSPLDRLQMMREGAWRLERSRLEFGQQVTKLHGDALRAREGSGRVRGLAHQLVAQAEGTTDPASREALLQAADALQSRSAALQAEADSLTVRGRQLEEQIRELDAMLARLQAKMKAELDAPGTTTHHSMEAPIAPEVILDSPADLPVMAPVPSPPSAPPSPPAPPAPKFDPLAC